MAPGMPQLTEEQRRELEEKLKNMSPEQLKEFQKKQCIFCQITSGKVPSKAVYDDAVCLAVLDINPAAKGHLLLIPKEHYAIMPQVPDEVLKYLFLIARHFSQIMLKALRADGVNLFVANGPAAGQRAQHFMIHVIPRKEGDSLLAIDEKLIDHELIAKIKSVLEPALKSILEKGGEKKPELKREKKASPEEQRKEEPEHFITSATAKRYHKEKCPFAQNIPAGSKVVFSKEQALQSGKEPCTCVTGRKIPLKKPPEGATAKEKEPEKKMKSEGMKEKTKREEAENTEDVSLDDIADLFK